MFAIKTIPYSEFLKLLKENKVTEVAISANQIQGKIKDNAAGKAALGYTMQTPTEDRFLMNKSELLNRIATLLGGRAAEEIVFEDISTGAHNDLARATDIARSMVKEYGMSAKVGQVYFARGKRAQFLNVPMEGATRKEIEYVRKKTRKKTPNRYRAGNHQKELA